MEKNKLIIIASLSIILILLIIVGFKSTIFGETKEGQIVDSATGTPIQNVKIVRVTEIKIPCFDCDGTRKIRAEVATTNLDGKYNFDSFTIFKSPFNKFYRELLYVNDRSKPFYNENDIDLDLEHNTLYESRIIGLGFSGNPDKQNEYVQNGELFQPFNSIATIKLDPFVFDISECNDNEQCINKNNDLEKNCAEIDNYSLECKDFNEVTK
jgi:hypothetical protein